jgi:hypothetical protein
MSKEHLLADLEYASQIARDGAETPLVGGPIGLMWGILLSATFALHYLIVTQTLALPGQFIGWLWVSFAILGGMGVFVLNRKTDKKPGAHSLINRVEKYIWLMFTAALASMAVGILLNQLLNGSGYELWTIILIAGFAGQGLAYGVTAKLTGHGWLHFAALAGFTMAAVTMSFYNDNIVYLIAAIGTVFTVIIPSLLSMRTAG